MTASWMNLYKVFFLDFTFRRGQATLTLKIKPEQSGQKSYAIFLLLSLYGKYLKLHYR